MTGGGTVANVVDGARGVVTGGTLVVGLLEVAGRGRFVVNTRIAEGVFAVVGLGCGFGVVTGTKYVGLLVVVNTGFSFAGVDETIAFLGQQTPGTKRSLKQSDSRRLIKLRSN